MSTRLPEQIHDAQSVRAFFDGWNLYRRIVESDYLYHHSVRDALNAWLDAFERPFSFLDLGCGDAEFGTGLLKGRAVLSYTGIDISPVALDLAAKNTRDFPASCSLQTGDFLTALSSLPESFDLIYIGLSLHHLKRGEKEIFFNELRRKLKSGGRLLIFDPVLKPGESRESYMRRWVDHAKHSWSALTGEEVAAAVEHVTSADHPEEISTLNRMASASGFRNAEILFADPTRFYALMVFRSL